MKYREIYAALAKRRMDVPGFRFSDYSGWRSPTQSYMTRQRPLWIVAEDPSLSRRLWITQEGRFEHHCRQNGPERRQLRHGESHIVPEPHGAGRRTAPSV